MLPRFKKGSSKVPLLLTPSGQSLNLSTIFLQTPPPQALQTASFMNRPKGMLAQLWQRPCAVQDPGSARWRREVSAFKESAKFDR